MPHAGPTAPQPPQGKGSQGSPLLEGKPLLALKLAVTVLLSAWIISWVDWGQFWRAVAGSRLWIVGSVAILLLGGLVLSAYKWREILSVHGLRYPLSKLVRWYLVASFFNHFLPSSVGGDGYRIYKTWHNRRGKAASVLAIGVERVTGMAALALLGFAAALALYIRNRDALAGGIVVAATFALVATAAVVALSQRLGLIRRLAGTSWWEKYVSGLITLGRDFREHPRKVGLIAVVSFVFHANKILAVWLLLLALGIAADPLELTVAVFAVEIAGLIPISLGGLGLVEGSFLVTMTHFGVGREVSLAAVLLLRVLVIPLSLVGAILYFLDGGRSPPGRSEALDNHSERTPERLDADTWNQ